MTLEAACVYNFVGLYAGSGMRHAGHRMRHVAAPQPVPYPTRRCYARLFVCCSDSQKPKMHKAALSVDYSAIIVH